MSSVIQASKNLLRFLRPGGTSHIYASPSPPLFQRRAPWWAKYTWALIACDAFMTGSAIDLTWKHWSEPIDGKSESEVPPHPEYYQPRPVWQRLGLCLGFFIGGVSAASALLIAGFRYTKVLDVFPPLIQTAFNSSRADKAAAIKALEQRRVFIQSARHSRHRGTTFPLSQCTLHRGRADSELLLTVNGEKGHWYIGLDDDKAVVNGLNYKGNAARDVILKAWKGGWVNDDLAKAASIPDPLPPPKKKKKSGQKP